MKTAIKVASLLACAVSLNAQITTSMNRRPDGSTEIRIRNDSAVRLEAFAIRVSYATQMPALDHPAVLYADAALDALPALPSFAKLANAGPLLPNEEFTLLPEGAVAVNRQRGRPVFEPPVTAGIFADGTTTGDAALLSRLLLRRSNMLLAVETALETLSEAGRGNVPREQLMEQFRKAADSVRRWYLPPEQQVGLGLYQSIAGKLKDLPPARIGAPFPPDTFVAQETAILRRHRAALLDSRPSLADAPLPGR